MKNPHTITNENLKIKEPRSGNHSFGVGVEISIIIPIFNEAENLPRLFDGIRDIAKEHHLAYEIIAVDDGSTDQTEKIIREASNRDKNIKAVFFSRNYGQTAALSSGIANASGEIIIPIDADLENDPADIPILLEKLNQGYDIVSGWRKKRWQGQWLTRKLPSLTANKLISFITGTKLHDYGCTLKAYRRESVEDIPLYGDMHRFVPAYAASNGYKVAEIPVHYKPRKFGKSKYGFGRAWKVLLDLMVFKFLTDFSRRPIHLFGSLGFISIFTGLMAGASSLYYKFSEINHKDFVETPLLVIMAMLIVVGIMLIMMGLLAEILIRTYFENQNRKSYKIKEKINL